MTQAISPSDYLANQKVQKQTGNSSLGKEEFLKLLIAQLQNQDPSNPMDDREFIAQMATFSSLEQMINMNNSLTKFIETQKKASLANFTHFLGKEVTWERVYEQEGLDEPIVEKGNGIVTNLEMKDDNLFLVLDDGAKILTNNVVKLENGSVSGGNKYAEASALIGKFVSVIDEAGEQIDDFVRSVYFQNGNTLYELADGYKFSPSQIIKITTA